MKINITTPVSAPAYTSDFRDELGMIRLHSKAPNINLEVWDYAFLEALSIDYQDNCGGMLDENIMCNMDEESRECALKSIVFGKKVVAEESCGLRSPNCLEKIQLNFKRKRNKTANIQYFSNASDASSWLKIQVKRMSQSTQPIGKN